MVYIIIDQNYLLVEYRGLKQTKKIFADQETFYMTNVTGPVKIDHVSTKNPRFLACLLYHNLITIYATATKSSSLLQNLMGFLLQLTEMG